MDDSDAGYSEYFVPPLEGLTWEEETSTAAVSTSSYNEAHFQAMEAMQAELTDEYDSALGSEDGSAYNYESVTRSALEYRVENGRVYHGFHDGIYLIPSDGIEQDRLDLVYASVEWMFEGRLHFAPLLNPQRILDNGTGTGIWAIDMAHKYPGAQVVGVDLSAIQPSGRAINTEFRVDDIENEWGYETPFDFIHSRICSGVAIRSWPEYLSKAYTSLRPGGWVEAQEFDLGVRSDDNSLPSDSPIQLWHDLFHEGMLLNGCNLKQTAAEIRLHMEEAGFVNIHVKEMKWPIAPWHKDHHLRMAGLAMMRSILDDISGMSLAVFTRVLGWDRIELELFLTKVKKEWLQKRIHAYWPLFVVYGQRPFEDKNLDEVEIDIPTCASAEAKL